MRRSAQSDRRCSAFLQICVRKMSCGRGRRWPATRAARGRTSIARGPRAWRVWGRAASALRGLGRMAPRAGLACSRRARARVGRDAPFRADVGRRATAWSARARRSRACAAGAARGEPGALVRARAMGSCTSSAKFCTLLSRASRGGEHRCARQACPEVVVTRRQCAQGPTDPRKGCCHSGPLNCPCGCSRSQIVTKIRSSRKSFRKIEVPATSS
jgi:hypothetical protein